MGQEEVDKLDTRMNVRGNTQTRSECVYNAGRTWYSRAPRWLSRATSHCSAHDSSSSSVEQMPCPFCYLHPHY